MTTHYDTTRATNRVSRTVRPSAWRAERRRLCVTPATMLASAAALRLITGPEGRKLYTGGPSARVVRRTLALAARLEREAKRWEPEWREARNAARREQARSRREEQARVAA
jgi:hypothetical protein